MNDAQAQFFVMLGSLVDDARLAHFALELTLNDGKIVFGVPESPASPAQAGNAIDDTGYRREVVLDGVTVHMPDVRAVSLARP